MSFETFKVIKIPRLVIGDSRGKCGFCGRMSLRLTEWDESEIINGWIIKLLTMFLFYRNSSAGPVIPVDGMANTFVSFNMGDT